MFHTSMWFISHVHLGESLYERADRVGWEHCPLQAGLDSVSCLFYGQVWPISVSCVWGRAAFWRGALPRWLTQKFNDVSCLLQMPWRCVLIGVCSVGSCWRHRPQLIMCPVLWGIQPWSSLLSEPEQSAADLPSVSYVIKTSCVVFMNDFYHSFLHCRLGARLLLCMNQIMQSDWPKLFAVLNSTQP